MRLPRMRAAAMAGSGASTNDEYEAEKACTTSARRSRGSASRYSASLSSVRATGTRRRCGQTSD